MWPFTKSKIETRASGTGYTAAILAARQSYISGQSGIAEMTATVQSCVGLWEGGLSLADVSGTDLLDGRMLALAARALALRGEAVFVIREDGLVPCADWDLRTKNGQPTAYRISIPEIGGGRSQTALAGEILHFRTGSDVAAPWTGEAPLRRARLTAGLLQCVETALSEVFEFAPLGTSVLPFPEAPDTDMDSLARGFRANRGKIVLRESVNVSAAGGPAPQSDWKPSDISPDLSKSMTKESLSAARDSILAVFGVLPGLFNAAATGPMVREAQRHLAQWALQPLAGMIAAEATHKLDSTVKIDVMRPLQAYDSGGRARTVSAVVGALAVAKGAGIEPGELEKVLALVDWEQ